MHSSADFLMSAAARTQSILFIFKKDYVWPEYFINYSYVVSIIHSIYV